MSAWVYLSHACTTPSRGLNAYAYYSLLVALFKNQTRCNYKEKSKQQQAVRPFNAWRNPRYAMLCFDGLYTRIHPQYLDIYQSPKKNIFQAPVV